MEPDKELKERIDEFLEKWVDAENRNLVRKRDVEEKGKKLAFALYMKGHYAWFYGRKKYIPSRFYGGITQETYKRYRDYIDAKLHEFEVKESWITYVLKGEMLVDQGHGVYSLRKKVPAEVWGKIKPYMFYANRDWYEDMDLGDLDYWEKYYGWATNDPEKVAEILRKEAGKRATEEHWREVGAEVEEMGR